MLTPAIEFRVSVGENGGWRELKDFGRLFVERSFIFPRGPDRFDPNATISRQEMVVMLVRAMAYAGYAPPAPRAEALAAVAQAIELKLIGGVGGGRLEPEGTATRAQAAAMLLRMLHAMNFSN